MLSKVASRTFFWVFRMTWPGIEPRSPRPLVNTLIIRLMASILIGNKRTHKYKGCFLFLLALILCYKAMIIQEGEIKSPCPAKKMNDERNLKNVPSVLSCWMNIWNSIRSSFSSWSSRELFMYKMSHYILFVSRYLVYFVCK